MNSFTSRMNRLIQENRLVRLPGQVRGPGVPMSATEQALIGRDQSLALQRAGLQQQMTKFVDGVFGRPANYGSGMNIPIAQQHHAPDSERRIFVVLDSRGNGAKEMFFAGQQNPPHGPWKPVMKFEWDSVIRNWFQTS